MDDLPVLEARRNPGHENITGANRSIDYPLTELSARKNVGQKRRNQPRWILWRDPYDELIVDLERAVPPEASGVGNWSDVLVGSQIAIAAVLSGSPEQQERAKQDPRVRAFWASCRQLMDSRVPDEGGDSGDSQLEAVVSGKRRDTPCTFGREFL